MSQCRTVLKDVAIDLDKARVFQAIDCREDSPVYQEVNRIYNKVLEIVEHTITPMIIFEFRENRESADFKELKNSKVLVYTFVTLGQEISTITEELFGQGNYLEALILDAMTNELLFNMTEEAYKIICSRTKERELSLKARISPGDEDIPFHYQKHIWQELRLQELGIQINESYTFQPLKSIGFIYTTTAWNGENKILHQCENCKNLQCKMRR